LIPTPLLLYLSWGNQQLLILVQEQLQGRPYARATA
jgi:hypothetical protein